MTKAVMGTLFNLLPSRASRLCLLRLASNFAGSTKNGENYYQVLEVTPSSDANTIKKSFYALSKKLHPDMKPEDEEAPERFKKLVEAYEVLGDPEKKKSYDDQIGVNKRSQRPTVEHRWAPRPRYGVEPPVMRHVNVDLSEERMKTAWLAYKQRWIREEEQIQKLEEKKLIFRIELDHKREMYEHLSESERESLKESMRLFRNPKYSKQTHVDFYAPRDSNQASSLSSKDGYRPKNARNTGDTRERVKPLDDMWKTNISSSVAREDQEDDREILGEDKDFVKTDFNIHPGNDPLATDNPKSTHREYFEKSFQQAIESSRRIKENWDEAAILSHGGVRDLKYGIRPQPEYNVSPWKVSVMVVLLGALWWFNYAFRTDTDDNNVFLKQLKEEKTHKKQQPEV